MTERFNLETEKTGQYILLIRIEPEGFCFAAYNPAVNGSFTSYRILVNKNEDLLKVLEEAVYEDPVLLCPFQKIYILLQTERFTFVPQILETEGETEPYYHYCHTEKEENILENRLEKNGIYNLFGIDKDLYAFLQRTFDNPMILHHLSPLCEYFYTKSRLGNNGKMYVNLQKKQIDILCFNKKGLLLANTFPYEHINDGAYHILNVWQQIGLDQMRDEVQLAGESEPKKMITHILQEYISYVIPSVFPAQLFKMGKGTMGVPFDMIITPLSGL